MQQRVLAHHAPSAICSGPVSMVGGSSEVDPGNWTGS